MQYHYRIRFERLAHIVHHDRGPQLLWTEETVGSIPIATRNAIDREVNRGVLRNPYFEIDGVIWRWNLAPTEEVKPCS